MMGSKMVAGGSPAAASSALIRSPVNRLLMPAASLVTTCSSKTTRKLAVSNLLLLASITSKEVMDTKDASTSAALAMLCFRSACALAVKSATVIGSERTARMTASPATGVLVSGDGVDATGEVGSDAVEVG